MILLLGANGQVGRELARSLAPIAPLTLATRNIESTDCRSDFSRGPHRPSAVATEVAPTRAESESGIARVCIDLADLEGLARRLNSLAPRIVVNAAAYTAVDRAEDAPQLADVINHRAVAILADWAARNDALLVHYSTDYVFAGGATIPYDEHAPAVPVSVYGRSKLAGEEAVRTSGCAHLILRTAWVFAPHGQNFLRSMLRAAQAQQSLRVVADQFGAPTSARYVAATTARLLAECLHGDSQTLRETLHVACAGTVSWHGYANHLLARAATFGLLTHAPNVEAIDSASWPTRAPRPPYSVLNCDRLAARLGVQPPGWDEEVDATLLELVAGHKLYQQ